MKKQSVETIEHRLRETLKRRGYRLEKSRRRDPHALTFGRYWIIGERTPIDHPISFYIVGTKGGDPTRDYTMTLDEVDALCSAESNAFVPISQELYEQAKMDCYFAMEAYTTERRETAPEKESAKVVLTTKEARATNRPRSGRG